MSSQIALMLAWPWCRCRAAPAHLRRCGGRRRDERQRKPNRGSLTGRALDADMPMMPFDNRPADIEADAKANLRAAPHIHPLRLVEPLPDVRLVGERDADSLVMNGNPRYPVLRAQAHIYRLVRPRELGSGSFS